MNLSELKQCSPALLQRKYQIDYSYAVKLYEEWLALQPKEPTPQELFAMMYQRYLTNPPIRDKVTKKRHTPYNYNGKYYDTYNEFQEDRNDSI